MSQWVDTNTRTFIAGGAYAQFLRVKLSSGVLAVAGITDKELGTLERASFASGDPVSVILRNKVGTKVMVANGAISLGADVFTAANGKVGPSASTAFLVGTALQAAAADGDLIEVLPHEAVGAAVP